MSRSVSGNLERVIPTQVCLPEKMILALDAQAKREELFRGRSVIVRRAVTEYLNNHQCEVALPINEQTEETA